MTATKPGTPLTDAKVREHYETYDYISTSDGECVSADFARRLEQDRARLVELLKRSREELRLIRVKDCQSVYDITLRIQIEILLRDLGES